MLLAAWSLKLPIHKNTLRKLVHQPFRCVKSGCDYEADLLAVVVSRLKCIVQITEIVSIGIDRVRKLDLVPMLPNSKAGDRGIGQEILIHLSKTRINIFWWAGVSADRLIDKDLCVDAHGCSRERVLHDTGRGSS